MTTCSSSHVKLNVSRLLTAVSLALPALALLWFIRLFAVNVVFLDDWLLPPLIKKMSLGTLTFQDLFAQNNEHRIFFPLILMLLLQKLTQFNTIGENLTSWVFLCFTEVLVFSAYKKQFGLCLRSIALFLPVSALLFNLRQYEGILWGSTMPIYMMSLGAVATCYLLNQIKKVSLRFFAAILSATVASFSFIPGLMIWPTGLFQLLFLRKRDSELIVIWTLMAFVVFAGYFYGWVHPPYHPSMFFVFHNSLTGVLYALALMGSPLWSVGLEVIYAISFGAVLAIIGGSVIVHGFRQIRANELWWALILFSILAGLATTIGRSGFGIGQAVSSRYVPIVSLGLIGLYVLAMTNSYLAKRRSFNADAILVVFLIGLMLAYPSGFQSGQSWHSAREISAYVLLTYETQSDENIYYNLFGDTAYVRSQSQFLEQNHLNVFSSPRIDLSRLRASNESTLSSIDTINGQVVCCGKPPIVVVNSTEVKTISIVGWAIDNTAKSPASAVEVIVDGNLSIPCMYGLDRPDVAQALSSTNSNYEFTGFLCSFSSTILTLGAHYLTLDIVNSNQTLYYQSTGSITIVVT